MTYGLRPWELDLLTRREWNAICDDHLKRIRDIGEVSDGF